jgi:hypothetical protein
MNHLPTNVLVSFAPLSTSQGHLSLGRTAVQSESDGITTGAYRARACSRPYREEAVRNRSPRSDTALAAYFYTSLTIFARSHLNWSGISRRDWT